MSWSTSSCCAPSDGDGDSSGLRVVVVDDHHHCLPDVHLAIRQRQLPFSDIHVVHVDAHPDLSFPATQDAAVVFQPDELYELLDESVAGIAEFQLPLVFAGHVSQITWLKPVWATQMPTGEFRRIAIGKRKTDHTNALGVACGLPHFVEDELFCSTGDMIEGSIHYWDLFPTEVEIASAGVSSSPAAIVSTAAIANARARSKGWMLDIDLDYFSTWNPFRRDLETRISASDVATVAQVYSCVRYKRADIAAMSSKQRVKERNVFVGLMTRLQAAARLQNGDFCSSSEWTGAVHELTPLYTDDVDGEQLLHDFAQVVELYRGDEATQREIWSTGPFLDLPHHESSQEEIEHMVADLGEFLLAHSLDSQNPPALVTVAKSTGDEFLPPHQLSTVLSSVLRMLERVYGELSTHFVEYEPV